MRPTFDAQLIADLRLRVIEHNEAHPQAKVKLGELRKVYEKNFRRSNPGARAMHHVDRQLAQLAKADDFEADKHPRGTDGRFASDGAPSAPTVLAITLPQTSQQHALLQSQNAGYKALTTDALNEHRFEAAGTVIQTVGSLTAGAAIVGLLARARAGGASERVVANSFGAFGRLGAGSAGSALGAAAVRAARVVGLKRPDAADAIRFRRAAAQGGETVGNVVGSRTHRVAAAMVQGALDTAGNGDMHHRAVKLFDSMSAQLIREGQPPAEARAAAMKVAVKLNAKLKRRRQRVVFGGLSLFTGVGIRNQLKDSIVDPAQIGRTLDDASFRLIQKRAADTPELGLAFRRYTEVLAKGGSVSGSIDSLGKWVASGGGADAELRKAVPLPWGRAAARVFTGIGALTGAAAGGAAAYGVSRATQRTQGAGQFDEEAHPRATDGKFTSKEGRNRRAAQVGGILGGAAAGIAVAALLGRRNARLQTLAVSALQRRGADELANIRSYKTGAAKRAIEAGPARIKDLIENGNGFKAHRELVQRIKTMGASDPTVVQTRLQRAYHERLAELLSTNPALQLPLDGGFAPVRDFAAAGYTMPRKLEMQRTATLKALGTMTREEFQTAVSKLQPVDQAEALKVFDDGVAAVKGVPEAMQGHSAAITAAQANMHDLKTKEIAALDAKRHAEATLAAAPDGTPKEVATVAVAETSKTHAQATLDHKKAATATTKLQNNPSGVTDPFTNKNIQPPTEADIEARLRTLYSDATVKATKVMDAEAAGIMQAQEARHLKQYDYKMAVQAVRGVRNGAPRAAGQATKALADLYKKTKEARLVLRKAVLAHAPNEKELADLNLATKRTKATKTTLGGRLIDPPARVMSKERLDDLRAREEKIRAAHTVSAGKVEAAQTAVSDVNNLRMEATSAFRKAMDDAEPKPADYKPGLLSVEARRDLDRVKSGLSRTWKDFVRSPTSKKLKDLTDEARAGLKAGAKRTKDGVKGGAKRAYEDLLTRDDGKGRRELSPAKVVSAVGLAGSALAAAENDLTTVKDRMFGTPEEKATARAKSTRTKFEQKIDPISGAGYYALSVANPKKKGERTVVWAERFDSVHGKATPIVGGGPLSELEASMKMRDQQRQAQKFQQPAAQGQGALRRMTNLPADKSEAAIAQVNALRSAGKLMTAPTFPGGPSLELASPDHGMPAVNEAAGSVINHLGNGFGTARVTPEGDDLHKTLDALFSIEGRTLSPKQVYRELTGYKDSGEASSRKSILTPNTAYAKQGADDPAILTALAANLTSIGKRPQPLNKQETDHLHRAVAVIAHVKKLSASGVEALHTKIAMMGSRSQTDPAGSVPPAQPAPAPPPAAEGTSGMARSNPQKPKPASIDLEKPASAGGPAYSVVSGQQRAMKNSMALGEKLGFDETHQYERLATTINGLARNLTNSYDLSAHEAVDVVSKALHGLMSTPADAESMRLMLTAPGGARQLLHDRTFLEHLSAHAEDAGGTMKKSILLDDLDQLLKISMGEFVESMHPRAPSGAIDGGEFVAGTHQQSGVGGKVAGEVVEAGGKNASVGGAAAVSAGQRWSHPVRMGNELGSALGYETAFNVASRALPAGIGTFGRLAAETVLGMAGGAAGAAGGNAIGQSIDRSQTGKKKAAEYAPPEDVSIGQTVAGVGGAMAGGMWGNAAGAAAGALAGRAIGGTIGAMGGPLGAIALGTVAGYAGEKISSGIYGYFAGYDAPAVKRAMTRFVPNAPPGKAP